MLISINQTLKILFVTLLLVLSASSTFAAADEGGIRWKTQDNKVFWGNTLLEEISAEGVDVFENCSVSSIMFC